MLNLVDPMDRSVLHSQPITSIRVWGVGRDNGRLVIIIPTVVFFLNIYIDFKNTLFHGLKVKVYLRSWRLSKAPGAGPEKMKK